MLLAFTSLQIRAELVENLYQSELLVSDRLVMPDSHSLNAGIKQVVMKVSGTIEATKAVDKFSFDASHYLTEFRFEATREVQTDNQGNDYLAQRLIMQFEPQAVDSLLLVHGFKPLGKYRPKLLIWLVGGVSADKLADIKADLIRYASSVEFPVNVVVENDRREIDRKKRLLDRILYRSKVHGKTLIIIVSVDNDNSFAWRMLNTEKSQWQTVRGELTSQLAAVFEVWIASSGLSVIEEQAKHANSHQIIVTSVKNMADYAAVMEYLQSLPSIDHLEVVSMSNETLILSLHSRLTATRLTQVLGLDRRMMLMRPLRELTTEAFRWRWLGTRGR